MSNWILTINESKVSAYDGKIYVHFTDRAEFQRFLVNSKITEGMMCSSSLDFPEEYGMTQAQVDAILAEEATPAQRFEAIKAMAKRTSKAKRR